MKDPKIRNDLMGEEEDDEDDDEDEDYNEFEEKSASSDTNHDRSSVMEAHVPPTLSRNQQKAVDEAFESLFHAQPMQTHTADTQRTKRINAVSLNNIHNKKQRKILSQIFGGSKQVIHQMLVKTSRPLNNTSTNMTKIIDPVTETMESKHSMPLVTKKTQSGLDAILSKIDAPDKMSTLTKTSLDWDQFKDKEGLEEDLTKKAVGKDAYILKQEFLQRVDERRFEHEKAVRDERRAVATANSLHK